MARCWRSRAIASSASSKEGPGSAGVVKQAARLTLWPKRLCYLILGIGALFAGSHLGLPWWQIAGLMAPLLLMEWILRALVARRLPRFERQLMSRINEGASTEQLLRFYKQHLLLRFAAPRHEMQSKLALIFRSRDELQRAVAAYQEALEDAPENHSYALALALADSFYELERYEDAERLYRQSLDEKHRSGRACANMARLIQRRQGDLLEAEEYLRHAVELSATLKLRCELIQLLLDQDRVEDAGWELGLATESLEQGAVEPPQLQQVRQAVEARTAESTNSDADSDSVETRQN